MADALEFEKRANKGSSFMPSNRSQTLRNDQIPFISLIFLLFDC